MKTIINALTVVLAATTPLWASGGSETTGNSLLVILFLGFGALIVVCQLVPGLALFCSMMKGLFGRTVKKPLPVADHTEGTI